MHNCDDTEFWNRLDMCDLFNMLFCNDMLLFDFSGLEDSLFWRMIFHQPGMFFGFKQFK